MDERAEEAVGECVEKDEAGRPYQCGAFVSGDGRWECRLDSDHTGEHEWQLRSDRAAKRLERAAWVTAVAFLQSPCWQDQDKETREAVAYITKNVGLDAILGKED